MSYAKYNTLGVSQEKEATPEQLSGVTRIKDFDHKRSVINNHTICVIDMFTTWCGPCKKIAGRYADLAKQYDRPGVCILAKEDTDDEIPICNGATQVGGVPTFFFFVRGECQNNLTVIGADINKVEATLKELFRSYN
jgi:thioredoxin 1